MGEPFTPAAGRRSAAGASLTRMQRVRGTRCAAVRNGGYSYSNHCSCRLSAPNGGHAAAETAPHTPPNGQASGCTRRRARATGDHLGGSGSADTDGKRGHCQGPYGSVSPGALTGAQMPLGIATSCPATLPAMLQNGSKERINVLLLMPLLWPIIMRISTKLITATIDTTTMLAEPRSSDFRS